MYSFESSTATALDLLRCEARKYERLDQAELAKLAKQARLGSEPAREKMILHSLCLAIWLSRTISHTGLDEEERFGLCLDALLRAVKEYDPARGKFETFAVECMKNALFGAFAKLARHARWEDKIPHPTGFLAPDSWAHAREELSREAEKVSAIVRTVRQQQPAKHSYPVFTLRFDLAGTLQQKSMREVGCRLGLAVSAVWEALDATWDMLKQEGVCPHKEKDFIALIERVELFEEITGTFVFFDLPEAA